MKFLLFLFLIALDCVRSQFGSNFNTNQQQQTGNLSQTDLYDVFGLPPGFDDKGGNPTENNLNPTPIPGTGVETCECVKKQLCSNTTIGTDGRGQIDIREQNRCNDYLLVCCSKNNILPNPPAVVPERGGVCGKRNPEGVGYRILGGKENEAQFGEYPWMVAILREDDIGLIPGKKLLAYKCGASIIHPKVVLTSAHCVDEPGMEFRIRAGEWDTKTTYEFYIHQDRGVQNIIIHPNFYKRGLFNDVALIVLDKPFDLGNHIQTVCLPSQDEVLENLTCTATGWGKKSFDRDSEYQVILKRVNLPIVQRDICQERLRQSRVGPFFILDPSLICAGGEQGIDTCAGDGGSPLVCPIRGKRDIYQQRGLVAWGIGCGDEYPAAYGNVAYFRNWIDNEMFKLGLDTSTYTG